MERSAVEWAFGKLDEYKHPYMREFKIAQCNTITAHERELLAKARAVEFQEYLKPVKSWLAKTEEGYLISIDMYQPVELAKKLIAWDKANKKEKKPAPKRDKRQPRFPGT